MHPEETQPPKNSSKNRKVLFAFLAIAAYFLLTEHRAHVVEFLPYLLLLSCLVLHLFMHRGGGHGSGHKGDPQSGQDLHRH